MHRALRACFCMLVAMAASMAPAHAGQKAFDVPEAKFFERVHRVGVTICKFPSTFAGSDTLVGLERPVIGQVDSLIVATLRAGGLEVIPGVETVATYDSVADSLGGIFDPVTGKRDSTRSAMAEKLARERIEARSHVDAWVYPAVYGTTAAFSSGTATWHGVNQKVTSETFSKGFLKVMTLRAMDTEYQGHIAALSLFVGILGDDDAKLYSWSGGIHVTSTFHSGKFALLPESQYFADRARIALAVEEALESFSKAAAKRAKK